LRDLRQRRERAGDWMAYAGWTAMGTAALALSMILVAVLQDPSSLLSSLPLLSAAIVQGLVGWQLSTARNEWNAWALMTLYALTFVIAVVRDGIWSNLPFRLVVGAVYIKGFLATVEYHELAAAIAAHPVVAPHDAEQVAG
jgi:hypothetical protein